MFVLAIGLLLGLISVVFAEYLHLQEQISAVEKKTFQIDQLVYQTQNEFKEQVQEWKNLLLRGHEPEYYENYLNRFNVQEAYTRTLATRLLKLLDEIPEAKQILENFIQAHVEAGRQYRNALEWFNMANTNRHVAADLRASGIDRVPSIMLDDIVRLAEDHRQQVRQQIDQQQNDFLLYSLCLIGIFIFLVGLAVLYYLRSMVIRPIDFVSNLAHKVASGDFSTSRTPPKAYGQSQELIDALLDMQQQLQVYAQRALDERERLESAVQERTADLEEARAEAEVDKIIAVRAMEEAELANETKSRFLANISHELRTPLHAILSFSSIGIKKTTEEHSEKYFNRVQTSGARLLDLIDQLLNLAKLESGKTDLIFKPGSLTTLIDECLAQLESLLEVHEIRVCFSPGQSYQACFDHKQLMQVLINLLSNAIKFSPRNSEVLIEIASSPAGLPDEAAGFVTVSVTDEGVGIPENELQQVFESFFQSSKTRENGRGTGLGLPIAREIILAHGGQIWAESPPPGRDRGTCFAFHIPLEQACVQPLSKLA